MLQNVGLSLGLIAILIPLAALGVLGLAAVVLVHEVAEIFVIERGAQASDHWGSVVSAGWAGAGVFFLRCVTRSAATCWR